MTGALLWYWYDVGGATRAEHLVVDDRNQYWELGCGMIFEPEPRKDVRQKPRCKSCTTSLARHRRHIETLGPPK